MYHISDTKRADFLSCITLSHLRYLGTNYSDFVSSFYLWYQPFPLENFPSWSKKNNWLVFFHSGRSVELVDTMYMKPLLWRFSTIVLLVQFPILLDVVIYMLISSHFHNTCICLFGNVTQFQILHQEIDEKKKRCLKSKKKLPVIYFLYIDK